LRTTEAAAKAAVTQVGPVAARALTQGARGQVGAVFERSFYVILDGQWMCFGPAGIGDGPLNVICDGIPSKIAGMLSVNDKAGIENGHILFERSLLLSLSGAKLWAPPPVQPNDASRIAVGLAALDASLPEKPPADGLALLLRHALDELGLNPVATAAMEPARYVRQLASCSDDAAAIDPTRLTPLIGLGPGLTPSGDDFVGGALIALHQLGRDTLLRAIWQAVAPLARAGTTAISFAHLSAGAEGFGHAALHGVLQAVIAGQQVGMHERMDALARLGHTSGWDALAGAVTVLRATAQRSSTSRAGSSSASFTRTRNVTASRPSTMR
jgi:hypothetical protein